MANSVNGSGGSSWWNWCCCCCKDDATEPGETDRHTGTKQERLLDAPPPETQRMGREVEQGDGPPKRSHSPVATYSQFQTAKGTPDSPMK